MPLAVLFISLTESVLYCFLCVLFIFGRYSPPIRNKHPILPAPASSSTRVQNSASHARNHTRAPLTIALLSRPHLRIANLDILVHVHLLIQTATAIARLRWGNAPNFPCFHQTPRHLRDYTVRMSLQLLLYLRASIPQTPFHFQLHNTDLSFHQPCRLSCVLPMTVRPRCVKNHTTCAPCF